MHTPKISVIIPYRDRRQWHTEALASVNGQTYPYFEIIEQQGDFGVSKNLNDGISRATGDWVTYLSDDDLLPPRALEYYAFNIVSHNGRYSWYHGNAVDFWEDGRRSMWHAPHPSPTLKSMTEENKIHGGTVLYASWIFRQQQFDEALTTGEEYEFNMRLINHNFRLGYINQVLYCYRRHGTQKSLGDHVDFPARQKYLEEKIKNQYRNL